MSAQSIPAAKFVLHGLEETLAVQLCDAVSASGGSSYYAGSTAECLSLAEQLPADGVFCTAKANEYRQILNALKQKGLRLPVVVVSRLPEVAEWLDALEAGAADYCAAPFERHEIRWLMESASLASECRRKHPAIQ